MLPGQYRAVNFMIEFYFNILLFQEEFYHFLMYFPVGLIPHRQVDPCLFIYNTLIVGESIKTYLAVISPHTTFAESSKSHFSSSQMNDCIVDTASSESTA